ncbi:unnamed protein product [marine sediment metagenome]|uniref:Uncharacterized protein n=1 Tax=marine sediment metagenome TaxID=412755 RepID=X1PEL4_9ZZZZ
MKETTDEVLVKLQEEGMTRIDVPSELRKILQEKARGAWELWADESAEQRDALDLALKTLGLA